jgi:hypothetical protein
MSPVSFDHTGGDVAQISPVSAETKTLFLGPFVGDITDSSVKIWLNIREAALEDQNIYVTLQPLKQAPRNEAERVAREQNKQAIVVDLNETAAARDGVIHCLRNDLGTGVVTIDGLNPNTQYSYELWEDADHTIRLNLNPPSEDDDHHQAPSGGLQPQDLFFWTLPEDGYGRQLDFLLMTCHFPETKKDDGFDGFAVWNRIPEIIKNEQNANVRFAILAGDQIYADEVETKVLNEEDPAKRRQHYLDVYRKFWNNEHYRRVLCRLPAVLIWDDHDITDGWGSREDSFQKKNPQKFDESWLNLFNAARDLFRMMQALRNPEPLSNGFVTGFDTCFRVGRAGFVLADLRSHRNVRAFKTTKNGKSGYEGQIWLPEQLQLIKDWIRGNREHLDTLFFVSPVVFSHAAPQVANYLLKIWFQVITAVNLATRVHVAKKAVRWFNDKVGDLRDDINDSWGSDVNRREADRVLDFLFELENPQHGESALNVVILSGDIHTPGYSTIYSANPLHREKAVIPHIVASPVAYEPFSWVGEAIFRHLSKVVKLGCKGIYTSQVSHHFCYRNVVVVSLRNYEKDESHLKVKYYLEGFPEPQVMLFDLNHGAHRESIQWFEVTKPKLWRRFVAWLTRTPIPTSSVATQPAAPTAISLPDKPVD